MAIQRQIAPTSAVANDGQDPAQGAVRHIIFFDKNPAFCEMLAQQLSHPGTFRCHGHSADTDLLKSVRSLSPDLLVVDPVHLDLNHAHDLSDFTRSVKAACPSTRIIAYSFEVSPKSARATLEAGFLGCLSKSSNLSRLELAIAAVLDGGMFFDQEFGAQLRPLLNGDEEKDEILSEREKEVLVMIARGHGAKQIAYELKISTKTVDTYKARAVQKLGLGSRAQLVEYVIDNGWIA